MPKVSICIPSHNNEKTIFETLKSAEEQDYPDKEILLIDDASTDNTVQFAKCFTNVRIIKNEINLGIGKNLVKLMNEAHGKYVIYLCADDLFADNHVVSDYVSILNTQTDIGVLGRYLYYFMDNPNNVIGVCRDQNIITQSCCPSGLAFRKMDGLIPSNKIFIEMPSIVAQYLKKWRWSMIEYDTIASRFLPGVNTGTKTSYYTESPWQNWVDLTGDTNWKDYSSFIMLKNRAPKMLWKEICLAKKLNPKILLDGKFYLYALTALIIPSFILRRLTVFYRSRIGSYAVSVIKRK